MSQLNVFLKADKDLYHIIEHKIRTNVYFEPIIKRSPSFVVEQDRIRCPVVVREEKILQSRFGCYAPVVKIIMNQRKIEKMVDRKIKKHFHDDANRICYLGCSTHPSDSFNNSSESCNSEDSTDTMIEFDFTESSGLETDDSWI
jgi:hypothetical protein